MIEDNIVIGLEKISQINRLLTNDILINKGLSLLQNQFLKFISDNPIKNNTISNLALEFNLKKSTVSDSIKGLLIKGLLEKVEGENDKRFYYLKTSKKAKDCLSLINKKHDLLINIINEFSEKDKNIINIFLMKFIKSLHNKGYIKKTKMCLTCNNFIENKLPGDFKNHFCNFLNMSISNEDLKFNCSSYAYTD